MWYQEYVRQNLKYNYHLTALTKHGLNYLSKLQEASNAVSSMYLYFITTLTKHFHLRLRAILVEKIATLKTNECIKF